MSEKVKLDLTFLDKIREKIKSIIETHLDNNEVKDWGFYTKSNCAKDIEDLLKIEGVSGEHKTALMEEAESLFSTQVVFWLGIMSIVDERN